MLRWSAEREIYSNTNLGTRRRRPSSFDTLRGGRARPPHERAGLPVEILHLKAAYGPGWGKLIAQAAEIIQAARERGVDVAADQYPYTACGTGLASTIPSWVFDGGPDSIRARMGRPEVRERPRSCWA